MSDWPTTTRTVEKIDQEKKELAEGKRTPITDAAKKRIKGEKRAYKKRTSSGTSKKTKGPKKSEFADDFVPYPDTGHDMEQLMNFPEHKQQAVLGKNWPDFKKRYLKK